MKENQVKSVTFLFCLRRFMLRWMTEDDGSYQTISSSRISKRKWLWLQGRRRRVVSPTCYKHCEGEGGWFEWIVCWMGILYFWGWSHLFFISTIRQWKKSCLSPLVLDSSFLLLLWVESRFRSRDSYIRKADRYSILECSTSHEREREKKERTLNISGR